MREGEELKTPRHASAAASRDDRLPHSRHLLKTLNAYANIINKIYNNILRLI